MFNKPPVEIVKHSEWGSDSCGFFNDGSMVSDQNPTGTPNNYIPARPDYFVGFFELPPPAYCKIAGRVVDYFPRKDYLLERHKDNFQYLYEDEEWRSFYFEYLDIPIPIKCTVRDMTPEERLLLSHDEKLTEKERGQKQEAEEEARQKLIQEIADRRTKISNRIIILDENWNDIKVDGKLFELKGREQIKKALRFLYEKGYTSATKKRAPVKAVCRAAGQSAQVPNLHSIFHVMKPPVNPAHDYDKLYDLTIDSKCKQGVLLKV